MTDKGITRRQFNAGVSATVATTSTAGQVMAKTSEPFDLVIRGGRVMDPETNFDKVANVGVKGGRIAAISTEALSGGREIDATGHVVAPGFIDTHFHWCRPLGYKIALRDGRTTVMDLEMGTLGHLVNDWYAARQGNTQLNFGCASAHEFARAFVLDGITTTDTPEALNHRASGKTGWSSTRPTIEQGNAILRELDAGLAAGAIAVGSTLGYMRDGSSAREVFEIQKLGGLYGRPSAFHFRYTPGSDTQETNGIQEMLANAAALGAPAIACHFNNPGYNLVHELLSRMRERGMNVWGEYYPYAAGSTALNAVFLDPKIWEDELGHKFEETLQDPVTGKFMSRAEREEVLKTDPAKIIILYKIAESAVPDWVRLPGAAVASDTMPVIAEGLSWDTPYEDIPNSHPRGAGSFAKVLRLCRESNVPLMQGVAQTSWNSARPLSALGLKSMQERGRIQEGMVADITVFNPKTVTDKSTYLQGSLPSEGIPYVIVNGTVVVDNSEVLKGVNPGQPIRFDPVQSRMEPLSEANWKSSFYVTPHDFGGGVPNSQPAYNKSVIRCCE
ncbi:MAG: hypothetical protein JNM89_05745 [Hyphomicrobiaceae bacterium]|nr:hypothetical protein [Hyphomicrobiaceae bacterium]